MTAAMLISGTIGWFVVMSGQPVSGVVFWRCFFGALTLLVVCTALGLLRPGIISLRSLAIAVFGGIAIVSNWLLLFASYSHASISIATTVYNTQPFMLLALGALFLGRRSQAPSSSGSGFPLPAWPLSSRRSQIPTPSPAATVSAS